MRADDRAERHGHNDVRALFKSPRVAWPTILLWSSLLLLWTASALAGVSGLLPFWVCTPIATLCAFASFTPMHEAAHKVVARRHIVNEIVGHSSAAILMAPFAAFRYAHLEHHKHTGDPILDPDHFSGRGKAWQLPLRWLTIDAHYYRWMNYKKGGLLFCLALWASALTLGVAGYAMAVVFCWILPARIAIALVAFSFSYLPHAPHTITSKEDRYRATRILLAPGLRFLLLNQNYHLIHHLFPAVPFYRYRPLFAAKHDELVARGAAIWRTRGGQRVSPQMVLNNNTESLAPQVTLLHHDTWR